MSSQSSTDLLLDIDKIVALMQPGGLLEKVIPGFEPRHAQRQMMADILHAYNRDQIALIEAGTGTGKSMAYLIPALLWAHQHKQRTLISTHTITLQEQLIHKDIPTLTRALNLDIKAVLVKGMSNYICLRRLADVQMEVPLFSVSEQAEMERINAWADETREGSRSDLSFVPTAATWEKVCAESDLCNGQQCPYYQECHFIRARRRANDAQILVVNHHLLFADLAYRADADKYDAQGILPPYQRIILDEAHHIEDIATDYFAERISRLGLMRALGRISSDKQGKLVQLKSMLEKFFRHEFTPDAAALFTRLNTELPGLRNELTLSADRAFETYVQLNQQIGEQGEEKEHKLRLLPQHQTHPFWKQFIVPHTQQLMESILRFSSALRGLEGAIQTVNHNENLEEKTKGIRFEIQALADRLEQSSEILKGFISESASTTVVRWIEHSQSRGNPQLAHADLDVATRLANSLFNRFATVILCSATMTTNRKFDFMRQRLGLTPEQLPHKQVIEHAYESPFNYPQQALFIVPTDIPNPQHPDFQAAATEKIWQAIEASRGNAFVLFTSYSMLQSCYEQLIERLNERKYVTLKQGDDNRQALLNRFKATNRSVLFGTDSFWEGVDVVGEALRCVILVKLPFKVPSEPITAARTEAIVARGGEPFSEYALPNAIVKFKQGVGRLIRNKSDRGCIVCLDTRIVSKGYGKEFLNSLPPCQQMHVTGDQLQEAMTAFYRKTHHLTVKKV